MNHSRPIIMHGTAKFGKLVKGEMELAIVPTGELEGKKHLECVDGGVLAGQLATPVFFFFFFFVFGRSDVLPQISVGRPHYAGLVFVLTLVLIVNWSASCESHKLVRHLQVRLPPFPPPC